MMGCGEGLKNAFLEPWTAISMAVYHYIILNTHTHTHTHTHIDFSRKKIKIKEGKKVPSIKAKNNGPVMTRGRARPFDLLGQFVDNQRRPRLHTRTAPIRMHSENRIPVKKLVSNSPPGPLYG